MRRPGQLADGIFVSDHRSHGTLLWRTDVECTDGTVNARRRQDGRTVFVPVMRQRFRWGTCCRRNARFTRYGRYGRGMDRNLKYEMVGGGGGGAEIEDANVGVGGDAGEDVGGMRREGGGVGATVRRERNKGLRTMRRPYAHGTVPTGGAEAVFGD